MDYKIYIPIVVFEINKYAKIRRSGSTVQPIGTVLVVCYRLIVGHVA